MKTVTTTIFLFSALHVFGQANFHFDSSARAIDSLHARLSLLASSIKNHDFSVPVPSGNYRYTITIEEGDSTVVRFFDQNSLLIFRKINKYNKEGCRWWEIDEIYNSSGQLVYWEAPKWSCLKPEEKNDPDARHLDAFLYEKERLAYDSQGRVQERAWWYTPLNTVRRYRYTYDKDNHQSYIMSKHDHGSFWK